MMEEVKSKLIHTFKLRVDLPCSIYKQGNNDEYRAEMKIPWSSTLIVFGNKNTKEAKSALMNIVEDALKNFEG